MHLKTRVRILTHLSIPAEVHGTAVMLNCILVHIYKFFSQTVFFVIYSVFTPQLTDLQVAINNFLHI